MSESPKVKLNENCYAVGGQKYNAELNKMVDYFLGIRYGFAERFDRPIISNLWSGVKNCTRPGNICPQDLSLTRKNVLPLPLPDNENDMSEDCLNLNIWRPSDIKEDEKLPVIVWVFSAHFFFGSANVYGGESFCCLNRVILVCISFRMGTLAFMTSHDDTLEGNYGFLDQVTALKWVQNYIEYFGGDKNNVTLFGISAASAMVSCHLASKLSSGLFHKAICSSGNVLANGCRAVSKYFMAELCFRNIVYSSNYKGSKNGKQIKEHLKSLSFKDLVKAIPYYTCICPIIDNYFLTEDPDITFSKGEFNDVPLLTGCVSDEGYKAVILWLSKYDDKIKDKAAFSDIIVKNHNLICFYKSSVETQQKIGKTIEKRYMPDIKNSQTFIQAAAKACADQSYYVYSIKFANYFKHVYLYDLHYRPTYYLGPQWINLLHANDLVYIFGEPFLNRFLHDWNENDKKFSMILMNKWGDFAKTGKIENWNLYEKEKFNSNSIALGTVKKNLYNREAFEFWTETIQHLVDEDIDPMSDEDFDIDMYLFLYYEAVMNGHRMENYDMH